MRRKGCQLVTENTVLIGNSNLCFFPFCYEKVILYFLFYQPCVIILFKQNVQKNVNLPVRNWRDIGEFEMPFLYVVLSFSNLLFIVSERENL